MMMVVAVMIMSINLMLLDLDLIAFMNRLHTMMVLDVSCIKDMEYDAVCVRVTYLDAKKMIEK